MKSLWKQTVAIFLILSFIVMPQTARSLTIKEEEDLSQRVLAMIRRQYDMIQDPVIVEYINQLGQNMLKAISPQPFNYRFYVIEQPVYNAFATPAGHIFFNSGLIAALENEHELAGIMAHEIAHVTRRHISQKIAQAKKVQLATLAGMAAGALLGVAGAGAAAQGVMMGSAAAGQSAMLAYSRQDELEADETGLQILTRSGFDAEGLLSGLKIIRSKQWFGSDQIPTYLMTHPGSEERIINLANLIETQGLKDRASSGFDPKAFALVQTRLITLYGDETAAMNRFKAGVRDAPEDPINHYGYGLILARVGNRQSAIEHLQKALEKRAFDPFFLTDLGRVYYLDGRFQDALKTLGGALSIDPGYPEAVFYLGRTYIGLGEYAKAVSLLEPLAEKSPGYTAGFYALGEAYGRQKKMGEAHYYLGHFYWNRKDAKNAAFHLKRASQLILDAQKQEKINEMLKTVGKEAPESDAAAQKPSQLRSK